jgi:hypothetical protein
VQRDGDGLVVLQPLATGLTGLGCKEVEDFGAVAGSRIDGPQLPEGDDPVAGLFEELPRSALSWVLPGFKGACRDFVDVTFD